MLIVFICSLSQKIVSVYRDIYCVLDIKLWRIVRPMFCDLFYWDRLLMRRFGMMHSNQRRFYRHSVRSPRLHDFSGYSLVEVMIALMIAGLMFSAIFSVSRMSRNTLQMARSDARSVYAAQYEIEKLRSYPWATIEGMSGITTVPAGQNKILGRLNSGQATIKKTLYKPANIDETIYAVSVTVAWKDYKGDSTSSTLISLFTKTGMIK